MLVTRPADIEGAPKAAECVVETHRRLATFLRAGITLAEIDEFVAMTIAELSAPSCFLGYRIKGLPPFPSHSCLSVNDCIVHGTHDMTTRQLSRGDLVSIDIGVRHEGWIGDAAWTYAILERDKLSTALMESGKESLRSNQADRCLTSRKLCRATSNANASSYSCAVSVDMDTGRICMHLPTFPMSCRVTQANGPRRTRAFALECSLRLNPCSR